MVSCFKKNVNKIQENGKKATKVSDVIIFVEMEINEIEWKRTEVLPYKNSKRTFSEKLDELFKDVTMNDFVK